MEECSPPRTARGEAGAEARAAFTAETLGAQSRFLRVSFLRVLCASAVFSFLFGPLLDGKFSPVGVWLRILTARGLILRALETVRASLVFMVGVDRIADGEGIGPSQEVL